MPRKRRGGSNFQSDRARAAKIRKIRAECLANMTEAEKNLSKEKNRIATKLRRALMSPEKLENQREKNRLQSRVRRRNQNIIPLQEELKLIDWQLDTLQGRGKKINVDDKFELETRKKQLNQEIRDIRSGSTVPHKRKINSEPNQSQIPNSKPCQNSQKSAELTEAEKNLKREKNRINAKLRRAVMTPEEREKFLDKIRDESQVRRRTRQIKSFEEELKLIEEKLDALKKQGEVANVAEEVELETRKSQLNLLIQEIHNAPYKRYNLNRSKLGSKGLDEGGDATDLFKMGDNDEEVISDLEKNSDSEDDNVDESNLADLTYKVAEGIGDSSEILDEEDCEGDQKIRPNETIQEWVKRVSSTNSADNTQKIGSKESKAEKTNKNTIEDPQKIRLIVMKAKAKLVKLQDAKRYDDVARSKRTKPNQKIEEQRKLVLKLMEKYPEEFNIRVANNEIQKRRQRKKEIAAITRNNNLKPRQYLVQSTTRVRGHLRIRKLRFETKAQRIDRIAQKIKFKGVSATNVDETPEEVAARILKELEEAKEKYKKRYQQIETGSLSNQQNSVTPGVENGGAVGTFNSEEDLDEYLQWYKLRQYLETPEEKAERNAKLAAYAREKNKMEKGEYNLFQLLSTSPNASKSLEDEASVPEILNYWKKFKHKKYKSTSTRKPPDFLIEWRLKTYSLLYDKEEKESETEKNTRFDRQNEDLKKWLEVNGAELTEYLNKRRHKMSEYLKKRNKKVEKEMTEEEKDAKRRKLNEKYRQHYLKKKLAEGIAITPKGERPHANKYYKKNPEVVVTEPKVPKPRRERRIKYSGSKSKRSVGSTKIRKIAGTKSENWSYPISESESVSTSSDMAPPQQNPSTSNTASMYRVSSSENNSWPTLGLVNASSMEEDPGHDDEGQQDDGDDWVPVNSCLERSFEPPVNQIHQQQQQQQFGGNQFVGVHNSNPIQSINLQTSYDEIFHRLIGVPPQNSYNPFGSQIPSYQPTFQSGVPSVTPPNHVHFPQHHYHQIQQHQTHHQNIAQSSYVPLNYSVPLIAQSEVEVPMQVSETNYSSRIDIKSKLPLVGRAKKNPPKEDSEQVNLQESIVKKVKRTRRPNGSAPLKNSYKKLDSEKPRQRRQRGLKGAVIIDTTSAPVVLESAITTGEIAGMRCTYCSMLFNTVFMCQIHIKKFHESKTTYSCKVCPQVFTQQSNLINHYWGYHRKSQPMRCPVCCKDYLHRRKFLNHLKMHPSERKSYVLGISSPKLVTEPDKFCCDVCPSAFDSFLTLINHRQEHKYICTVCGIILNDGDHLLEHTIRCHREIDWRIKMNEDLCRPVEAGGNTFRCETCESEFLTQHFLAVHEVRGHPVVEDSSKLGMCCDNCNISFDSAQKLVKHLKICSMKNFKCYWCIDVFPGEDLRLKHMRKNHSQDKSTPNVSNNDHKKLKCELCRNFFNSILKLRYHYQTRHIPNTSRRKKPKQNELTEFVDSVSNQNTNIENTNTEVKDNTVDSTTNKTMKLNPTPPDLRNELEVAVDSLIVDPKPPPTCSISIEDPPSATGLILVYPCNICHSKYKTEEFLEKHMNKEHQRSTNKFRFPCSICNKSFSDQSHLRRHNNSYHSSTKKTFNCPHCPRTLTRPEGLKSHIKSFHGGSDPDAQEQYRQRLLNMQKDKPHKCDHCEARFRNARDVPDHMRKVHHPKIAIFCELCGKQIDTVWPKRQLRLHMQKYHQDEADAVAAIEAETTPTASFGLGSVLQRIPLPEVIELIDELYYLDRHSSIKKPSSAKRVGRKRVRESRSKKKAVATEGKVNETEKEAGSEDSDRGWLSGDSSDDSNVSEASESDDSAGNVPNAAKRPKVSIKAIVIKPKKRIQPSRVQQEYDGNLILTVRMPSIILKRCDDLVMKKKNLSESGTSRRITKKGSRNSSKPSGYASVYDSESEGSNYGEKSVTIPDVDYKRRTRPSNASKRFNIDVDSDEEDSD